VADPADVDPRSPEAGGGASEGGGPAWLTPRRRHWIAYTLIGLACLLTLVSALTVWVKEQMLNTDRWVDTSSQLLKHEDVRDALATRMVDAVYTNTNVTARLQQRLPPALDPLAPQIAGALRVASINAAEQLLETPAVQSLWEQVNRRAHTRLVQLLEGKDIGPITTAGGDVVLDLNPLVDRLEQRLGLSGERLTGTGQITIMESQQLAQAQDAVEVINKLSPLLLIAVVVFLVAAVYLARGFRREAVRATAFGLLLVGLIVLVVRRIAGNAIVDALSSDQTSDAVKTVWVIGTSILGDLAWAIIALGIAGLVWAWISGKTRSAVWLRTKMAPAMRNPVWVYSVVAVVVLLILWWGPTGAPRRLVGTLIILALVVAGVEVLRRQILREHPDASLPRPDLTPAS
jgi:hypothetical protein